MRNTYEDDGLVECSGTCPKPSGQDGRLVPPSLGVVHKLVMVDQCAEQTRVESEPQDLKLLERCIVSD